GRDQNSGYGGSTRWRRRTLNSRPARVKTARSTETGQPALASTSSTPKLVAVDRSSIPSSILSHLEAAVEALWLTPGERDRQADQRGGFGSQVAGTERCLQ